MDAYLNFLNYTDETIRHARNSISQSNDLNFLDLQKERLELLVSMLNQLLLNVSENNEIYHATSTRLEEIQVLLNQYITQMSQLGGEDFVNINMFITQDVSSIGKYYIKRFIISFY